MPSVSKDSAAQHADHGPVEEWTEDVNGYTINFVRFAVDIDSTPLLKRLAGDAFYVEGGHLPVRRRGKRVVQFRPRRGAPGRLGNDRQEHAAAAGCLRW